MSIRCLLQHHDWKFSYHHGMPLGISTEEALAMIEQGKTYEVFACARCHTQARLVDGKIILLPVTEIQTP